MLIVNQIDSLQKKKTIRICGKFEQRFISQSSEKNNTIHRVDVKLKK